MGSSSGVGMKREPIDAEAALSFSQWDLLTVAKAWSDSSDIPSGVWTEGNLASNGACCGLGERVIFSEDIISLWIKDNLPIFIEVSFPL